MVSEPPKPPKISLIKTDFKSDKTTQVEEVRFAAGRLSIEVASERWTACVSFDALYGFRLLDELDLSEFWSQCTLADGWLFEVVSGGWKELELKRPHFISGHQEGVHEYLVIGLNECVSVLTKEAPRIVAVQPSNPSIERTCPGKPGHAAHVER